MNELKVMRLEQKIEVLNERVGDYQGICSDYFNRINKLQSRIGRLKAAQRSAQLPFKGFIY